MQLASQLTGRLLSFSTPEASRFSDRVAPCDGTLWLRPMRGSLVRPGGALIRTLEGQAGQVTAVAVTPDGSQAVSAADDNTLKVWDLGTGKALRTLEGHAGQVSAVLVTPDRNRAVSASHDHTLKVWDLGTGEVVRTLEGHTDAVYAVAVTPDGSQAVSASYDHTLKVWDLRTGELCARWKGTQTGSVRWR